VSSLVTLTQEATAPVRVRGRRRSITLTVGCICVGLIVAIAVLSFFYLPYSPSDTSGGRLTGPSLAHWAGTDELGRDLATQLMIGARIALAAGLGSVLIGGVIGITLGLCAAFASRWLDDALSA
jgi:peptide/nickel transport system permease protein